MASKTSKEISKGSRIARLRVRKLIFPQGGTPDLTKASRSVQAQLTWRRTARKLYRITTCIRNQVCSSENSRITWKIRKERAHVVDGWVLQSRDKLEGIAATLIPLRRLGINSLERFAPVLFDA